MRPAIAGAIPDGAFALEERDDADVAALVDALDEAADVGAFSAVVSADTSADEEDRSPHAATNALAMKMLVKRRM